MCGSQLQSLKGAEREANEEATAAIQGNKTMAWAEGTGGHVPGASFLVMGVWG